MQHQNIQHAAIYDNQNISNSTSVGLEEYLRQPIITYKHIDEIARRCHGLCDRNNGGDVEETQRLQRIQNKITKIVQAINRGKKNLITLNREDEELQYSASNLASKSLEMDDVISLFMRYFSFENRQLLKSVSRRFERVINDMPLNGKFLFREHGFIMCIDEMHAYITPPTYKQLQRDKNLQAFMEENDGLLKFYLEQVAIDEKGKINCMLKWPGLVGLFFALFMLVGISVAYPSAFMYSKSLNHTEPTDEEEGLLLAVVFAAAIGIPSVITGLTAMSTYTYLAYQQYTARKNARQLFGFFVNESNERKVELIADENPGTIISFDERNLNKDNSDDSDSELWPLAEVSTTTTTSTYSKKYGGV